MNMKVSVSVSVSDSQNSETPVSIKNLDEELSAVELLIIWAEEDKDEYALSVYRSYKNKLLNEYTNREIKKYLK